MLYSGIANLENSEGGISAEGFFLGFRLRGGGYFGFSAEGGIF